MDAIKVLGTVCLLAAATILTGPVAAQAPPTPTVSPDPLPDVPPTPPGVDPFPFFDDYSWRSFIALNWPALRGAESRGMQDRTKPFGDIRGPRVWATWKSRYEIFQPKGVPPAAWNSYDGLNPCGPAFRNEIPTLSAFTAFGDFNQAAFRMDALGNPLVAQNRTYARYEVRANKAEFDSIVGHKWYVADNLPKPTSFIPFNLPSTEIKAAWRILTDKDTPAIRARYYVVNGAQVFDVASGKCIPQDVALVGFHIVTKTPDRLQWIWSSFEHVDNVPGIGTGDAKEPSPPPGVPFSFNDPTQPQTLNPPQRPPAVSSTNPPLANPTPMQVIRKLPINASTMKTNKGYWELPQIKGTVWQNYMLVMTQWPTTDKPEGSDNNGAPFPLSGSILGNTTMETYFQFQGASCMECHDLSRKQGRDFVMFVTFDAFIPGAPAPGALFSEKIEAQPSTLESDPMIESLVDFFNAAQSR